MEQNVSERTISIPTADRDILNALDWKDGIGTLPGSNIKVRNQGTQYMSGHHAFGSAKYLQYILQFANKSCAEKTLCFKQRDWHCQGSGEILVMFLKAW